MVHPPESLRNLFWDTELTQIDCERHAAYVVERVSDHGDIEHWRWLLNYYGPDRVREIVSGSRRISNKSANLWRLLLNIPREEIACLNKSSRREAANF